MVAQFVNLATGELSNVLMTIYVPLGKTAQPKLVSAKILLLGRSLIGGSWTPVSDKTEINTLIDFGIGAMGQLGGLLYTKSGSWSLSSVLSAD